MAKESLIAVSILIEGKEIPATYPILEILVGKAVNKISYAMIRVEDGGVAEVEGFTGSDSNLFIPGNEVEIKAGYGSKEKSIFKGMIVKHGISATRENSYLTIECRDPAVKMTIDRKNAVFVDKKDSDIINDILKIYGLEKRIKATSEKQSEVIQYSVTDWDFVLNRADVNGLIVTTEDGKLVVDQPQLSASPAVELTYGKDINSFQADIDARTQIKEVESIAWDMGTLKIIKSKGKPPSGKMAGNLDTKTLAKTIGLPAYLLQSTASMPNGSLTSWASAKLSKSVLAKIRGRVEFQGTADVQPGDLIKLSGLSDRFNGNVFVGALEHKIEEGDWVTEVKLGMPFDWYTEEKSQINAASASGLFPPVKGLHTGIVKKIEDDPDGHYRVQIIIPILQKDNQPVWARLSHFYATSGAGVFFLPELGDEVIVSFMNEDPQSPVILGMLYSKKNKPKEKPESANPIKALRTKSGLEIRFDDEKKITTIETPGKNSITLDDDQKEITLSDQNRNKVVLSSSGISLDSPKDIKITAKGKITIDAMGELSASSKMDVKLSGLNIQATANIGFTAKGNATAEISASGQTTVKGAIVMIN